MEVREDKFTVKTCECQVNGNIKIASLMQYLQEVAALHHLTHIVMLTILIAIKDCVEQQAKSPM